MTIDQSVGTARMQDSGNIDIYRIEPKLKDIVTITSKTIANIDSTDANSKLWSTLIDEISHAYDLYDGFLITFGTNTLGYCSSALSYGLLGIGKPVVITGSQVPATEMHSDGRLNIINSCLTAASNLSGVYVVFGSRIIQGTRAKKVSESDYDSFRSFLTHEIGNIGVTISFDQKVPRRHSNTFVPSNGFEDRIASLTLFPGMNPSIITALIDSGFKGFVLRAFGGGDIPRSLFPALHYANQKEIPVVVTTQAAQGKASMNLNEIGLEALEHNVIQAFDMSIESMTTKMMWLLYQKTPYEIFKQKMHECIAGEIVIFESL